MVIDLDIMDAVERASGSNEKLALLKKQPDSAKELFRLALDPTITFGVTVDVDWMLAERPLGNQLDEFWDEMIKVLVRLQKRELTGNAAYVRFTGLMKLAPSARHVVWACRILMKDLRCGVSVSTINKVWPGLIDDLSVMLAATYDPAKHELKGPWALEPKLDGYRMTIVDGIPLSRNKRVFTTVNHILSSFTEKELATWVFDGEIMGESKDFDEAGGSIRRKGEQATGAVYHVFDCIPRKDWQKQTLSLRTRRKCLEAVCNDRKHIKVVQHIPVNDPSHEMLTLTMQTFIDQGYEGAMAKDLTAPYMYERSDALLKLKQFVSADLPVVGMTEGRGKHKGKLGALIVEMNGVQSKVGSGFTDEQRKEIWNSSVPIVGQIVECQYQNVTKDGAMRFPVFLRFRPDR